MRTVVMLKCSQCGETIRILVDSDDYDEFIKNGYDYICSKCVEIEKD